MNAHARNNQVEKAYPDNDYEKNGTYTSEPFAHGHSTVAEATGRGGDTHRGLKSRHIQFLYVFFFLFHLTNCQLIMI
jgi:amino acid transporter